MDAKITHRRDINMLSDSEVADYIHALDILRQRSAADPDDQTGYDFQAGLHNDPLIGPCEHKSDLFLPWHRAHLYYFEQLLQQSDLPRHVLNLHTWIGFTRSQSASSRQPSACQAFSCPAETQTLTPRHYRQTRPRS